MSRTRVRVIDADRQPAQVENEIYRVLHNEKISDGPKFLAGGDFILMIWEEEDGSGG